MAIQSYCSERGTVADHQTNNRAARSSSEYEIFSDGGVFAVRFNSPFNSIHRMSGFKTEDDAQAWIAEAKLLMRTFV
jgi:hypothetical protein